MHSSRMRTTHSLTVSTVSQAGLPIPLDADPPDADPPPMQTPQMQTPWMQTFLWM